jgi:hypothetical protein
MNPSAWKWAGILLSTCIAAHEECCSQESQNDQVRTWSETICADCYDLVHMFQEGLVILTIQTRIV